jgi:hypothetical protein
MKARRLPGMRLFQTAAAMALPIAAPTLVQSERSEMARATSWCGTEACDATWDATTLNEPPMPMKTWEMTRRAVSWTPCRRPSEGVRISGEGRQGNTVVRPTH